MFSQQTPINTTHNRYSAPHHVTILKTQQQQMGKRKVEMAGFAGRDSMDNASSSPKKACVEGIKLDPSLNKYSGTSITFMQISPNQRSSV
jgi:hypothetical protein